MKVKIYKTKKDEYAKFVNFCCDRMEMAVKNGYVFYDNIAKRIYFSKEIYYELTYQKDNSKGQCFFCGKEFKYCFKGIKL